MPPRKAPARRNKSSTTPTKAPTPVVNHELADVKTETQLTDDSKVNETPPVMSSVPEVDDRNEIESVVLASDSVIKEEEVMVNRPVEEVNEAMNEGVVVKEDLEENEDVDEDEEDPEEEWEENAEIVSAQEETIAVQADDPETLNDDNLDQVSDISKSLGKDNDVLVVNNGDVKGTTETVSFQEYAQAVSTHTSSDNNTALAVEDDGMINMDDDVSDDYSEEDDADSDGDGDQDPSLIVQDSSPDNKKEKGTELYVGKLDKNAVEEDLVSVFQQFGELKSTRIVRKPNSNKSKGFAFVRFASVDQAKHALSELKDGAEVRGKRVVISASQDNDTLYLGNICKTWTQEQVLQQLKDYGIEHIVVLRLPEDAKFERKNKGFAFLEFGTHSDAVDAFQRLKKPDVVFGRDISAKVAFAQTALHSEDLSQVNEVHLEGLAKDWNEEMVKDICKKYGEILRVNLCPGKQNKRRDFGFVTFNSPESAVACVEGINNTAFEGDAKIKASIAKTQQKSRIQKQGMRGGFKVEKQSENSNKNLKPKSSKKKGVLNKHPSKNKIKDNTVKPQQMGSLKTDGESSKEAELSKMKGDNDPQQRRRKRKAFSEQKSSARDLSSPKKQKNVGQGQNSQSVSKEGSQKRKKPSGNEDREDRGNRNAQGRRNFKKQKGNMHGRERDRRPRSDAHTRRGHDNYRNSTRYAPKNVASASNSYNMASDHSLSTMRYKEMEPHAGYIESAFGLQSGSYSGYVQPVLRTPHTHHQTVYLGPSSTSQSQVYTRYIDRPVMTQSHRGYIETAVAPEVQSYRDYRPHANVARDPYDSRHSRIVRHDDRGAGALTYVGGPPLPASQVPSHTTYYQAGGSYGRAYGSHGAYY